MIGVVLLCLAAGIACLGGTGLLREASGGPAPAATVAVFVAVFGAPGLALLSHVSGIDFHRLRGEAERWWGFGSVWKSRRIALTAFDSIDVRKVVRSNGKNGSTTVYPVRLHGAEPVSVHECRDPVTARSLAEELARYLELDLRSTLHGEETVRPWRQLDWSLRRRILSTGEAPPRPEPPCGSRLTVTAAGNGFDVTAPGVGLLRSGMLLVALAAPAPVLFLAFGATSLRDAPPLFLALFVGFALLPLPVLALTALRRAGRSETLVLRRDKVTVEHLGPLGAKTSWSRPSDAIEEITVSTPVGSALAGLIATGGVTLVTDAGACELLRGASDEERAYVRDLIAHVICGGSEVFEQPDCDTVEAEINDAARE